jgi:PAS domain S-box-containing protein
MSDAANAIPILHVDDEPDFADMVATFLEREDDRFHVETETSASAGLDRLSEAQFDCIITDYDMPGQSGIEFLEAVREDHPDLPVILFTGKGNEEVASNAISAGVTDYLQKGTGTDQYTVLTNRVQNAVERRKAKQERNRQLEAIETAQEGIAILDEDGHYLYVNQRFAGIFGYDPEGFVGEHWELAYRDEDIPEVREEILPEVEREGYWRDETIHPRADGGTVTVDHTLALTDRGELVCTVRDISDEKEREQALQEKTARLEALFENSPDMINIHDIDGNILNPNPRLCEKTGYDSVELTDMKVWDLDQAIDPDKIRTLWENMEVGDRHRLEGRYQHQDVSTFPVEVHIRRIQLCGGDRFVAIARDITERKEYEHELREKRVFVEQCLDALNDVFYVFGPDRDILRWNDRLSEVTGYSEEKIAEMKPADFFPDDHAPRIAQAVEDVLETGQATVQADFLTNDGERIPHEFTGFRLTDSEENVLGFVGIGRDLRQRREYEQQLQQRNERLEEFASIVSHDLRNPLTVAEGRLELAQNECDSPHLEAVADAHSRIKELIEELLTLAREGTIALDPEAVSLADLAQASWRTVATEESTLSIDEEATIWADESRLRQLLENLFHNAVEHGGGNVTVRVRSLDEGGGFYIADDGPGVPEAERTSIFESGVTTGEDGIGAGLSIVKRVAEAHGWEINVTDSDSGGAKFEIAGVEGRSE